MNTHPNDPLSPEERALAERLRRIGGANGPAAALDARILAAARGAAGPVPARRRRWLAWSAVPGGAVTAVGTAAAFVLVVGAVWQLRPGEQRLPAREAADEGFVSVEMIERRETPAAVAPADAAAIESSQAEVPGEARATPTARARKPASAAAPTLHREAGRSTPAAALSAPAPAPAPSMAPPGEPAAAPPYAIVAPADVIERTGTPATDVPPARMQRRATYTTSARAAADARAPRALREDADQPPAQDTAGFGPARQDAGLPPADWLQRIRDRRAQGDAEGAAESLRLFRETHPRIRLPDDLRRPE